VPSAVPSADSFFFSALRLLPWLPARAAAFPVAASAEVLFAVAAAATLLVGLFDLFFLPLDLLPPLLDDLGGVSVVPAAAAVDDLFLLFSTTDIPSMPLSKLSAAFPDMIFDFYIIYFNNNNRIYATS
jgi:hypothetical protein